MRNSRPLKEFCTYIPFGSVDPKRVPCPPAMSKITTLPSAIALKPDLRHFSADSGEALKISIGSILVCSVEFSDFATYFSLGQAC